MNKRMSILFIFMLVFQTISSSLFLPSQAVAEGSEQSIFTGVSYTDEDGNAINIDEVDDESAVNVHVDWSIAHVEVEEGTRDSFYLPDELYVEEEQQGVLTGDEIEVGTYQAAVDEEVSVSFNDVVEEYTESEGTFVVSALAVEQQTDQLGEAVEGEGSEAHQEEEVVEEDVSSEDEESESKTNAVKKEDDSESVNKETDGTKEESETTDQEEAEEKVEHNLFSGSNERESQQITDNIIDELNLIREDGSIYEEGDFLDLNEDLRLELDWFLPNGHEYQAGDTFEFQLPEALTIYSAFDGDLNGYGTYQVTTDGEVTFTFSERIENESDIKGTFWTDTELNEQIVKKTTEELELVFNDEVIERITINVRPIDGQAIQKNGQPVNGNFNTEEIEWTVVVNTTREMLGNAVIHDPILDGQELNLDSIDVKEVEVNLEGHVVEELAGDVSFTDESSEEELNLNFGDTDKAYQITFRTIMTEDQKDEEGWTNYANTAYLNSDGKEQVQSGASVSVERPESLTKSSSDFNKEGRSVEWTVNANFTEKELSAGDEIVDEFTFTIGDEEVNDVFEITEGNIDIQQVDSFGDGGAVDETSDAKDLFDISIDGNKVTYELKDASNKAFVIIYKTTAQEGSYITDDGEISNTVGIDGKTETSRTGVGQQVGVKTNSGINYEDKTIDWTITVNADSQQLNNFVLTDDFSGSRQELVDGTIEVDPAINEGAIVPNEDGEGFVIDFGDINKPYTITYQTEFTYDFGDEEDKPSFRNGVDVSYTTTDGDNYDLEFGDNVEPNEETRSNGAKNSSVNNETKEIKWMIDINYNQLMLDNAELIDEMADNQSLVEDSVEIYPTTIDENGDISVGDEASEFNVAIIENDDGNEEINIDFGEIDQSYRVEFVTVDKDNIYNSDEVYENTAQFIPREGEVHNLTANATLPNQGEFLGKNGEHNSEDWTIDWELTVNESESTLTDATVTDDLGDESLQILLEDSIEVTKAGSDEDLVAGEDYEIDVNGNELSVAFPGVITDTYSITYSSYILAAETADISNEAVIESIEDTIVGNVDSEETVQVRISTGGGTGEGTTGELILEKVETDTDRPLENVEFTLVRTVGNQDIVVREGTTDENGEIHWTGLQFGEYNLEEVVPEGYLGDESQEVTLSSDAPEGIQTITIENERETGTAEIEKIDSVTGESLEGAEFSLINQETGHDYTFTTNNEGKITEEIAFGEYTVEEITAPEGYRINADIEDIMIEIDEMTTIEVANVAITEVEGEKNWEDADNQDGIRPESITVNLLADGVEEDFEIVTATTDWQYIFEDLPVYNDNDEEIIYTVEEEKDENIQAYDTRINGYDITNSYTPEVTNVSVTKEWDDGDNQDGNRASNVQVELLADDEVVEGQETATLEESNRWSYTWTDLPVYANGEEIDYSVQEVEVPAGYEVSVYDQHHEDIIVTNSYEPETTEITVNKVWEDEGDQDGVRPDNVTVNLLADGEIERQTVLDEDNNWEHLFRDLPVYENGEEIEYTVTENTVTDYSTSVESTGTVENPAYTVTNSYTPDETTVTVTKAWDDADNQDGNRPDTIEVQLLANGEPHGESVTLDASDWSNTWSELAAYESGEPIEYTVQEIEVPAGYEVSVNDDDHGNIIIANSYEPETTEVTVSKSWDDADNQDGNRPGNVTVNLLGDNEVVTTTVLDDENDWNHTFSNLPVYENGEEINYRVTENTVTDYSASIDGNPENGFVITNSYTPEETSATVTKAWNDGNNQDGNRPESIQVQLYANGSEVGEPVDVTASDEWTYTWSGLDAYAEGEAIAYTVEELNVPEEYSVTVNNNDHGNLIITNNYTPEVTEVPVTKVWDDDDDRDRVRPNNVTVNLLANGQIAEQAVLNEERDWEHTFSDLPVHEDGGEINYTVTEHTVSNYSTAVEADENGFVITNSYTPEETTATVTKSWNDADNQDGIRPETIEVQLLANGEATGDPVEITADAEWTYTWEGMPLNAEGEPITYSVEELNVPEGYDTSVNDEDHGNIILTNSYTPKEINISGTKTWDDGNNQDGIRPESITVNLLANGETINSEKVMQADEWSYSFYNLPKYEAGEEINYTIKEDEVEGYETEINGFDITNTHKPEEIDISGTKTWDDANNQDGIRPDTITVNLLANGEQVDFMEVTEEDNWSYSFENLPKYEAGKEINYTITEDTVEGYETVIDGFDITNTHTPEVIDVNVTKHWNDAGNQDGIRPESIEVNLQADGDLVDTVEVTAADNWNYTFTDLPKYEDGTEIDYTITEETVEAYETEIDGFNITNSYTPETTEVTGTKTWDDADNQDGNRPDAITVNLLANGEQVDSVEVTAENGWAYNFADLPKYEAGEEITYTVTENTVADYTQTIDGFDITNQYTPGQTAVTVTKNWDDANNQDNIRPEAIQVQLTADGENQGDSVELSEANNWTHTWTELDEKAAGETIDYSVVELTEVPEYETTVDDADHGNIIITNTYTPEEIEVSGTKTWEDADNQDGTRPESITVNLLANGTVVDSIKVAEDDWNYSFTNLPKYEAGEEIEYSITEDAVEGYETTINGYDITNTLIPEEEETTTPGTEIPEDPEKEDPTEVSTTGGKGDGERMPNTATNIFNVMLIGAGLLMIGLMLTLIYRKRKAV